MSLPYEVLALRYATHMRTAAENFVDGAGLCDPHDAGMPIDYFIWVIRNRDRTIIVDTGFTPETALVRKRKILVAVPDALSAVGVAAAGVQHVIITHLHYDHAGGLAAFPNAKFYIQDAEMAYATGRHMSHARLRSPFEVEDVVTLVRRLYQGRVQFVEGDRELFPGVSVHGAPGHTPGLQCVRAETARGAIVLASDAAHFYANIERQNPFPIFVNLAQMVESWNRIAELAGSPQRVIPGHDPLVLRRYPRADVEVVEAALLHLPPLN